MQILRKDRLGIDPFREQKGFKESFYENSLDTGVDVGKYINEFLDKEGFTGYKDRSPTQRGLLYFSQQVLSVPRASTEEDVAFRALEMEFDKLNAFFEAKGIKDKIEYHYDNTTRVLNTLVRSPKENAACVWADAHADEIGFSADHAIKTSPQSLVILGDALGGIWFTSCLNEKFTLYYNIDTDKLHEIPNREELDKMLKEHSLDCRMQAHGMALHTLARKYGRYASVLIYPWDTFFFARTRKNADELHFLRHNTRQFMVPKRVSEFFDDEIGDMTAPGLDDAIGVAQLLQATAEIALQRGTAEEKLPERFPHWYGSYSSEEEVGLRGAIRNSRRISSSAINSHASQAINELFFTEAYGLYKEILQDTDRIDSLLKPSEGQAYISQDEVMTRFRTFFDEEFGKTSFFNEFKGLTDGKSSDEKIIASLYSASSQNVSRRNWKPAFGLNPDVAIALDVCPASLTEFTGATHEAGPVIGNSTSDDKLLKNYFIDVFRALGKQSEVGPTARAGATNGDAMREHCRMINLSTPISGLHSSGEILNIESAEILVEGLKGFTHNLNKKDFGKNRVSVLDAGRFAR